MTLKRTGRRRARSPPRLQRRHRSVKGLQELFDDGDEDSSFQLLETRRLSDSTVR